MKIILLAIVMCCTSFTVVKKKLYLCYTYVVIENNKGTNTHHIPRVISGKDYKEARSKFLHLLMYKTPEIKGGTINTDKEHFLIQEITEEIIH